MSRRMISAMFSLLLLVSLVACRNETSNDSSISDQQLDMQSQFIPMDESEKAEELLLREYIDCDLGYSLLCPDVTQNVYGASDYWYYKGTRKSKVLIVFSEYQAGFPLHNEKVLETKDPHEVFEYFLPIVGDLLSVKEGTFIREKGVGEVTWMDMSISGLNAARFNCTLSTNGGEMGIVGICIVGEKRPYMFWAMDLSKDQSNLIKAQEILEKCVLPFKEGD